LTILNQGYELAYSYDFMIATFIMTDPNMMSGRRQ